MLNLGDIYARVGELLGKDQYGGYLSPASFNDLLPWINVYKMNELIKVFEEKQEISRDLQPFVVTLGSPDNPPITLNSYGYGEYPSDYYYFARASFLQFLNSCGGYSENARMVQFLNQADFNYRLSTSLMYPTLDEPIAVDENDKFRVVPNVGLVSFTYVRTPATPIFDYELIDDVVVYLPPNTTSSTGVPSTSVEFEFPLPLYEDLANLIVQQYAIKIRSEFNLQTSPTKQGQ